MRKALFITFLLLISSFTFAQPNRVLLEYVTGTWCGNCPCSVEKINLIKASHPETIVLAYHGHDNGADPWWMYSSGIRSLMGLSAQPSGVIGRTSGVLGIDNWSNAVNTQSAITPKVKIVVNTQYNAVTRQLTASANLTALENLTGTYRINFVLIENNLIYPQNYYSNCGTPGYQNDYVHKNVVKEMINGDSGMVTSTGNWNSGTIITKTIDYVVPNSPRVTDPANCKLVAFVYQVNGNYTTQNKIMQAEDAPLDNSVGISNQNQIAKEFHLAQNYPNPFNPKTIINFSIPKSGEVSISIYNSSGIEAASYRYGVINSGSYNIEFDGSNLASGLYYYSLNYDGKVETRKMVLVK